MVKLITIVGLTLTAALSAAAVVVDGTDLHLHQHPRGNSKENTASSISSSSLGTTGGFTISQVRNPAFRPHGPAQLARTYNKYGVPLPESLASALVLRRRGRLSHNGEDGGRYVASGGGDAAGAGNAAANDRPNDLDDIDTDSGAGTVPAIPEGTDLEYLVEVSLGTPAQLLTLDIDSGSADFWVFSTSMKDPEVGSGGQTLYDPHSSDTAEELKGADWEVVYGDGSSSEGGVWMDVVDIGGLRVEKQAIETARMVSFGFAIDVNCDGLIGLGFGTANNVRPDQQKTFFDNVAPSLDAPVWTADLKHRAEGSYDFGYIDEDKYNGTITWASVNYWDGGFWIVGFQGYGIDGSEGDTDFQEYEFEAIIDTGTTVALVPEKIVEAYYKQVPSARVDNEEQGWVFPCNTSLPNFVLGIEGAKVTIPGEYLNYAPYSDGHYCFGGLQSNSDAQQSILGDVILKALFVVFNMTDTDNPSLGIATKKLGANPSTRLGGGGTLV